MTADTQFAVPPSDAKITQGRVSPSTVSPFEVSPLHEAVPSVSAPNSPPPMVPAASPTPSCTSSEPEVDWWGTVPEVDWLTTLPELDNVWPPETDFAFTSPFQLLGPSALKSEGGKRRRVTSPTSETGVPSGSPQKRRRRPKVEPPSSPMSQVPMSPYSSPYMADGSVPSASPRHTNGLSIKVPDGDVVGVGSCSPLALSPTSPMASTPPCSVPSSPREPPQFTSFSSKGKPMPIKQILVAGEDIDFDPFTEQGEKQLKALDNREKIVWWFHTPENELKACYKKVGAQLPVELSTNMCKIIWPGRGDLRLNKIGENRRELSDGTIIPKIPDKLLQYRLKMQCRAQERKESREKETEKLDGDCLPHSSVPSDTNKKLKKSPPASPVPRRRKSTDVSVSVAVAVPSSPASQTVMPPMVGVGQSDPLPMPMGIPDFDSHGLFDDDLQSAADTVCASGIALPPSSMGLTSQVPLSMASMPVQSMPKKRRPTNPVRPVTSTPLRAPVAMRNY